uniref:Uncharacterized protein n=1 Tax=Ditylenchus dipsaci TaxID=166011 RepID=A0A915CXY6_9BILA
MRLKKNNWNLFSMKVHVDHIVVIYEPWQLQDNDALSFTTDIWSSTSYSFISLTAHGINQEWKRDKYVLAIRELQGSHTADVINTAIREILEEWEIKQEV